MRSLVLIHTTVDDQAVSDRLISGLLQKKLVACAQVRQIKSSYWWKDEIQSSDEFSITFKLPIENKLRVVEFIEKNHSYGVPEITTEDIKTTEQYFEYCHLVCDT